MRIGSAVSRDLSDFQQQRQQQRQAVMLQLQGTEGKDLVLVWYGPGHRNHPEWVYNEDSRGCNRTPCRTVPNRTFRSISSSAEVFDGAALAGTLRRTQSQLQIEPVLSWTERIRCGPGRPAALASRMGAEASCCTFSSLPSGSIHAKEWQVTNPQREAFCGDN